MNVTSVVRVVILSADAHKGQEAQVLEAELLIAVEMMVIMGKTVPTNSGHLKQRIKPMDT